MKHDASADTINQLIIEGITVSAATAIERARRFNVPLVVWANDCIVEIQPSPPPSQPNPHTQNP